MSGRVDELWAQIHEATPPGWFVGRPAFEPRRAVPWSEYAFDPAEKPKVGHRSREWTAVGMTEEACLEEIARCLDQVRDREVPR